MSQPRLALVAMVGGLISISVPAAAQPLGVFRWQLMPYCNVLTLAVTHQNGIFTLDGTDDNCGFGQALAASGIAFLAPNGTVGIGLTIVQAGATALHLNAGLFLPSLEGNWTDSFGNLGAMRPGGAVSGSPRPVFSGGLSQVASVESVDVVPVPLGGLGTVVAEIGVTAPVRGRVLLTTSGALVFPNTMTIDSAVCSITAGTTATSPFAAVATERSADGLSVVPFGGTRTLAVSAGSTTLFRLVCRADGGGSVSVLTPALSALFVAGS